MYTKECIVRNVYSGIYTKECILRIIYTKEYIEYFVFEGVM